MQSNIYCTLQNYDATEIILFCRGNNGRNFLKLYKSLSVSCKKFFIAIVKTPVICQMKHKITPQNVALRQYLPVVQDLPESILSTQGLLLVSLSVTELQLQSVL